MNEQNGDDDTNAQKACTAAEPVDLISAPIGGSGHLNNVTDVNNDAMDFKEGGSAVIREDCSERCLNSETFTASRTCHTQKHGRKRNSSECKSDDHLKKNCPCDNSSKKHHGKKHRIRVNRKRKWKPYCKLTWQERMKVEERDDRRAQRLRSQRLACGLTLAPNNTTQFLMNDHDVEEPDYESIQNGHKRRESNSLDSSDEYYSSPDDEEEYITHQFMEDYETVHDEYLNELPKQELVQQWISLEDEIEVLEKQLKLIRDQKQPDVHSDAERAKIQVFREEIGKLSEENVELSRQNKRLETHLTPKT